MNELPNFDGDSLSPHEVPSPTGWQIVLAPITIDEKTVGGIVLLRDDVNSQKHVRSVCKVLAVGPLAYTGDKFKPHPDAPVGNPWCTVGDVVTVGEYTGTQIPMEVDGNRFYLRVVSDDEIKTVINDMSVLAV